MTLIRICPGEVPTHTSRAAMELGADDLTTASTRADIAALSLHRSGHVPSPEEADLLKKRIALLEAEISASSSSTSALADQLALHWALLSPIRRLYPEILSHIFILATPEDWYEKKSGTIAHPCTQVCFLWREITIGTPVLWCTINIFVGMPDEERLFSFDPEEEDEDDSGIPLSDFFESDSIDDNPYTWYEEEDAGDSDDDDNGASSGTVAEEKWALITTTYIERSAQRPLSITYGAGREYVNRSASSERSWRLLAQEKARWMSADLTVPVEVFRVKGPSRPVPLLESLRLSLYSEAHDQYSPLDFFWDAPLLRQIAIDPHAIPTGEETILPSWCPTDLCVRGHTPRPYNVIDAGRLIRQCASTLENGGIWVSQITGDEDVPPALMTDFPALRSLVALDEAFEMLGFIRSAPELQSVLLRETTSARTGLLQLHAFSAMLARASWPSLTSLTLLDVRAPPEATIECLRAASMLSELIIRDEDFMRYLSEEEERSVPMGMNSDIMRALTRSLDKPDSCELLPNLSRLEVHGIRGDHMVATAADELVQIFADMLYSRAHALHGHESLQTLAEFTSSVTPLDRLTIDYVQEFGNEIRHLLTSRTADEGDEPTLCPTEPA